jgi:hypothetical protein
MDDLDAGERPPEANPASIGVVYLVSAFPSLERDKAQNAIARIQQNFSNARVVAVFLPGVLIPTDLSLHAAVVENGVSSFEAAVHLCLGQDHPPTPARSSDGRDGANGAP